MLPTQELFRAIPCPYYVSGLCERPHCFFRHTKSDVAYARKSEKGFADEESAFSGEESDAETKRDGLNSKQNEKGGIPSKLESKIGLIPKSRNSTSSGVSSRETTLPKDTQKEPQDDVPRKRAAEASLENQAKKTKLNLESRSSSKLETEKSEMNTPTKENAILTSPLEIIKDGNMSSLPQITDRPIKECSNNKLNSTLSCTVASINDDESENFKLEASMTKETEEKKQESMSRNVSSTSSSHHIHHKDENGNTHKHKSSRSSSKSSSSKSGRSSEHKKSEKKESSSSSSSAHKNDKMSTSSSNSSSHSKGRSHKTSSSSNSSKESSSSKSSSRHHRSSSSHRSDKEVSEKSSISSSKSRSNTKTDKHDKTDRYDQKNGKEKLKLSEELMEIQEDGTAIAIVDNLFNSSDEFQLPVVSDYEDDPDDIEMECLKMFEDYKPEEKLVSQETNVQKDNLSDKFESALKANDDSVHGRKRMAHAGADIRPFHVPEKPRGQVSRLGLTQQVVKRLESQKQKLSEQTSLGNPSVVAGANKKRIAHVSNISGYLRPKNFSNNSSQADSTTQSSKGSGGSTMLLKPSTGTVAQTSVKGQSRIAHQAPPQAPKTAKRPLVLVDCPTKSSKIPSAIRQRVLNQMFDSCCVHLSPEDAFDKAIAEEDKLVKRCSSKAVYQSLVGAKVLSLRKEAQLELQKKLNNGAEAEISRTANRVVSHKQILDGAGASNCSIQKVQRSNVLGSDNGFYKSLLRYLMTEKELIENGFPRPHPSGEAGRVVAVSRYGDDNYVSDATRRTCDRCRKVFAVNEDGSQAKEDQCVFHTRRKERRRVGKDLRSVFPCCGDESGSGSDGCNSVPVHVPKSHPVAKIKFVSAVREEGNEEEMGKDPWDIVALDCEMVYTTNGNELARATFIGKDDCILYDEIVKPSHTVLDYNTQYSGLTEEDISKAKVTITDVQAVMLTHVKPNSILIGHSLESDLIALRFKHDCVIDTSVLFPHRLGSPFKRALRTLSGAFLNKIIQNSDAGHDSAEDARTALHLVLHRLHEDISKAAKIS